ncbi:unnamed protein product [Trypanosoma congolense IL3000]|uniref:WGS project CAEQ00000000 data, annotated contig 2005 n=1 Tax=Trypanosoma congolense (strain IL3000) TaxID=1068625 RepID=F9WAQ9_TRYCI|nr:unnamed protein product [Trypanosoma congolense IL3000]
MPPHSGKQAKGEIPSANDVTGQPDGVCCGSAAHEAPGWTLNSSVASVLLEKYGGASGMTGGAFLQKYLNNAWSVGDVSLRVLMEDTARYVEEESTRAILKRSAEWRECEALHAAVADLGRREVHTLGQWENMTKRMDFADTLVKDRLHAALLCAKQGMTSSTPEVAQSGEDLRDVYDSVLNATWSYVVEGGGHGGDALEVKLVEVPSGEQSRLRSKATMSTRHDPQREGCEVTGCDDIVMAVLSSSNGWPPAVFDAAKVERSGKGNCPGVHVYICKEAMGAWRLVRGTLDRWLTGVTTPDARVPFTVIGTPDSGKPCGTGSLLLYQLLHYPQGRLKAVAYFLNDEAYIFRKPREGRRGRAVRYRNQNDGLRVVCDLAKEGIEGYVLFDCCTGEVNVWDLPKEWGVTRLSPTDSGWLSSFLTMWPSIVPAYVRRGTEQESLAVLAWERHLELLQSRDRKMNQVDLRGDFGDIQRRIYMVGPLPRYVLGSKECYERRVREIDAALRRVGNTLNELDNLLYGLGDWGVNDIRETLSAKARAWQGEYSWHVNIPVSAYVRGKLLAAADKVPIGGQLVYSISTSDIWSNPARQDITGIRVFTLVPVMDKLARHLKYLPREGETASSRSSVLSRAGGRGRVPTSFHYFSSFDAPLEIEPGRLYRPEEAEFPLVEGFFFVEGGSGLAAEEGGVPPMTLVLVQVTAARDRCTASGTVSGLIQQLSRLLATWDPARRRLRWEMIYVHHSRANKITERQRRETDGCGTALWGMVDEYQVELPAVFSSLREGTTGQP